MTNPTPEQEPHAPESSTPPASVPPPPAPPESTTQPGYADYGQAPPPPSAYGQAPPPPPGPPGPGYPAPAGPGYPAPAGYPAAAYPYPPGYYYDPQAKSRLTAGLLGIFLGGFGVHRFYLGYTTVGVLQILVTIATCGLGSIWGLIEGILILSGSGITTDANGRPLRE